MGPGDTKIYIPVTFLGQATSKGDFINPSYLEGQQEGRGAKITNGGDPLCLSLSGREDNIPGKGYGFGEVAAL